MPSSPPGRHSLPGLTAALVLVSVVSACTYGTTSAPPRDGSDAPMPTPAAGVYPVRQVIDGDTLTVEFHGDVQTVRLIGVDSPEVQGPYTEAECYGAEASEAARELLEGHNVRLASDPSQDETDRFGRRLAYVWTEEGVLVNLWLVEEGLAQEYTYDLDRPYVLRREMLMAEARAKREARGLWSPDACAVPTAP